MKHVYLSMYIKTMKLTNHSARKHMVQKLRDLGCSPTDILQISGHTGRQLMLGFPNCEDINLSNICLQTQKYIHLFCQSNIN